MLLLLVTSALPGGQVGATTGATTPDGHLAGGAFHTCLLQADGTVRCFGANNSGQLGDGTYIDRREAVAVAELPPAQAVSAGVENTCAVADSAAWCWGSNGWGQLGDGTTEPRAAPVQMRRADGDPLTGVTAVDVGYYTTCALAEGRVHCAGRAEVGQLGTGKTDDSPVPLAQEVVRLEGVTQVAVSIQHVCAVANGSVWCWGRNDHGQLGSDTDGTCQLGTQILPCALEPVRVEEPTDVVRVDTAGPFSCALTQSGDVWCWGYNESGQMGRPSLERTSRPVVVTSGATAIATGAHHACSLRTDEAVECWGAGSHGQTGTGVILSEVPVLPALIPSPVVEVAAGYYHTCARRADNRVWCWGRGSRGQLGYSTEPLGHQAMPTETPYTAP